jgi:hypothetical protein
MESEGDSSAQPGEVLASPDEVRDAVRDLSEPAHRRLAKAAHAFLQFHPELGRQIEPQELVDMAVQAALQPDGRKWPKHRVDIVKFLAEAMRSIVFNEARKLESGTRVHLVSEIDLRAHGSDEPAGSLLESLAEPTPGAEQLRLDQEKEAKAQATLALVRAQLAAEDKEISQILELRLQGVSKLEIRRRLGMGDTAFWTVDRRLTRRIQELLERLKNDDP